MTNPAKLFKVALQICQVLLIRHSYMPNRNAIRQQIKRVRRENTPSQPQSLEDLTIPDSLRTTIGRELFLINDSTINDEKRLLFCTKNNIHRLSHARYLIMDGTF